MKASFFSSLRARLLVVLLIMTALPALLIGGLAYRNARDTVKDRVMTQLTAVADLKKEQITTWLDLTTSDTRLMADNFLNQEHFTEIINPHNDPKRSASFAGFVTDNLLSLQKVRSGYVEIMFVDAAGKVVLSTDPAQVGANLAGNPAVAGTLASPTGEFIEDIHRNAKNNQIEMAFGYVLYAVDLSTATVLPQVNGAVIIRTDMNKSIYPLIRSWPGMGATGETLLGRVDGDSILFLTPLRFHENAALNLRVLANSLHARPAYLSGIGQEGILQTPDYRGMPVLSAFRTIPQTGWGFVVKEDQSEAFASLTKLTRQWIAITVLVLLMAAGAAIVFSHSLTGPLARLAAAAQDVASGRFENNVPTPGVHADEIGQLAAAFQKMITAVRERGAVLKTRAEELRLLNDMSRDIAATMDLHELSSHVVAHVAGRFTNFLSQLLLYDTTSQELVAFAAAGRGAQLITLGERTSLGHGLLGQAALTRQTQFANNTKTHPDFVFRPGLDQHSQVTVPILREDKLLGVLGVSSDQADIFRPDDILLLETLASQFTPVIENARLFRDLSASYDHTLDALAAALDSRDKETEGHSRRVVLFSLELAHQMEVPEDELTTIRHGALLHDIGKIGIPDAILLKHGPLTDEERAVMRNHPAWGRRILDGIPFLEGAAEIVFAHQERWDGKGYPRELASDAIPLGARIFAVADTFDAITSDRPYRAARPYAFAREEILAGKGTQFDPLAVQAFLQIPEDKWAHLCAEALSTPIADSHPPLWAEKETSPVATPEFAALHRLSASVSGSLNLPEILHEAVHTTVEVLDAAASALFLYDQETDTLTLAAEYGLPDSLKARFTQFPVAGFHNERVVRDACTVLHKTIGDIPAFVELNLLTSQPDWGEYLCVPLAAKGKVTGIMGVLSRHPHIFAVRDVELYRAMGEQIGLAIANARLYESAQELSIADGLTGAYNRRSLDDYLVKELQHCVRYKHSVSLIMLDIDHFKAYNDAHGHPAGDEALRQVAAVLKKNVRAVDFVARYGGEEFTVVLPETDVAGASITAEKIRAAIEAHAFPHDRLTASLGVAYYASGAAKIVLPDALIDMADQALYNAKQGGRNRVHLGTRPGNAAADL